MLSILPDNSKLRNLDDTTLSKSCLRQEDKINRCLRQLLNKGAFDKNTYNNCNSRESGIRYGLSKIRRPDVPLRLRWFTKAEYQTPFYLLVIYIYT